jgi:hypothetical protein
MEITVYVSPLTLKHPRQISNSTYLWDVNNFRIKNNNFFCNVEAMFNVK